MRQFGELEAVIMNRPWTRDRPALVWEAVDDLQKDRQIAYTTAMTVMDALRRKAWLRRHWTAGPMGPNGPPRLGILTGSSRPDKTPV
jgi:predicted transcriptional regulator